MVISDCIVIKKHQTILILELIFFLNHSYVVTLLSLYSKHFITVILDRLSFLIIKHLISYIERLFPFAQIFNFPNSEKIDDNQIGNIIIYLNLNI